jgi:hypothetical protein
LRGCISPCPDALGAPPARIGGKAKGPCRVRAKRPKELDGDNSGWLSPNAVDVWKWIECIESVGDGGFDSSSSVSDTEEGWRSAVIGDRIVWTKAGSGASSLEVIMNRRSVEGGKMMVGREEVQDKRPVTGIYSIVAVKRRSCGGRPHSVPPADVGLRALSSCVQVDKTRI